jgi:O-Antigen ligase
MTTGIALAVYALSLLAGAIVVWRRPVAAVYLWIVGVAVHNAVGAALYGAGVRDGALTAIQAWKEILLAVALARAVLDAVRSRSLPFRPGPIDALALAYGVLVCIYALIPQHVLGGSADRHAVGLALKHDLVPVAAYFVGRSLVVRRDELVRLAWTILASAAVVAALGLIDVYAIPISWWRKSAVVPYFDKHLGYDYHGTGGLPENFIYNVGGDKPFLRRLVSTFLSPLASGYLFVVALLVTIAALRRSVLTIALSVVVAAGLLWTFSRSSLVALAVGLVALALIRRRWTELLAPVVVIAVALAWAHLFPRIGPTGHFTKVDLTYQQAIGKNGPSGYSATSANEPSLHSHWVSLKEGFRTMVDHPQGYGLGNVGQTASRTGTPLKAGESNYTELGVELGVLGAIFWVAWNLALLVGLVQGGRDDTWAAGMAAAFTAVLALAIQTDVIGDPWVAYCVWGLGGALLVRTRPQERLARADARALAS